MRFCSLDEIHSYLEANVSGSATSLWELTRDIKRLADKTVNESIKKRIMYEVFAFDFTLRDGGAIPLYSTTQEDGKTIWAYPSYDEFGKEGILYLTERAKAVKNDFLVAWYNQILWNNPAGKHQQHAKAAIDAYLKILSGLNCLKEEKRNGLDCLETLKNGFVLSLQLKYKIDEFKELASVWLYQKNKFQNDLKHLLLKFLIEQRELKKKDFEGSLELIKKLGSIRMKKEAPEYFIAKQVYQIGLAIAQRFGTDVKIWNKLIGDAAVQMAVHRLNDETRMIPLQLYKEAVFHYRSAGLPKKVKEVEQKYFELKKELKLSKVEVQLPEKESQILIDYLNSVTEKLLENSPEKILGGLLSGRGMFPQKKSLTEMAKNNKNSFLDFVKTTRFDINKNISEDKEDDRGRERTKIFENYHFYVQMMVLPLLHRIFVEGIKRGKISFKSLMDFLLKNTWLGQELIDSDSGQEPVQYRWISLIAPSLHEYFFHTESAIKSTNPTSNYILPIDSLTLKFEGVLRDFSKLANISTTTVGKNGALREKYIEELLSDERLKKYFNEDDLLFFYYLFTKDGMNLRNNVAHCFYRFHNYSFQVMHLLICAFLRIGKYKINTTGAK